MADRIKLKQVFSNLIGNGLKYLKSDERAHVILKSEILPNQDLKIEIQDHGLGMSSEFMEKLFIPFHRYYRQDEYEGTGLGLSITNEFIKKHKGSITCHSVEDEGSTFTITLPQ